MIPLMALMIGAYIFTRMWEIMLKEHKEDSRGAIILLKLLAAATIILTMACVVLIFLKGQGIDFSQYLK